MKNSVAFILSVACLATACGSHKRELAKQGYKLNAGQLSKQSKDECPAAEGAWTLDGGTEIQIGRSEGFLTIAHPDLGGTLITDGKARKISQKSTGKDAEVTVTCAKQLVLITYKFEGKVVTQTWNVDLEKDILGIVEKDQENQKLIQGLRVYAKPATT